MSLVARRSDPNGRRSCATTVIAKQHQNRKTSGEKDHQCNNQQEEPFRNGEVQEPDIDRHPVEYWPHTLRLSRLIRKRSSFVPANDTGFRNDALSATWRLWSRL